MGGQQTSPMYQNKTSGALGGAMLGTYLAGPFGGLAGLLAGAS